VKRVAALCLALALRAAPAYGAAGADEFRQGQAAFQAGQFARAAELYQRSLSAQVSEGALLNLGLAEWRCGRAGEALLAWERALDLDPFQSAARENLRFARQTAQLEAPELTWSETASTWLPARAWAGLLSGSLWLAIGLLVFAPLLRLRRSGGLQTLIAVGFGVFLLSLPPQLGILTRARLAVVLAPDTPLRLTPTHAAETVTTLRAGDMVRCARHRGAYVFVSTVQGSGWVESNRMEFLRVPPSARDAAQHGRAAAAVKDGNDR